MVIRRRRDEGENPFVPAQHDLDWNTIVQVEPDVGVTPDDEWSSEHGALDPFRYQSSPGGIYDVEQEDAYGNDPAHEPIASDSAVEAWFSSDGTGAVAMPRPLEDQPPPSTPAWTPAPQGFAPAAVFPGLPPQPAGLRPLHPPLVSHPPPDVTGGPPPEGEPHTFAPPGMPEPVAPATGVPEPVAPAPQVSESVAPAPGMLADPPAVSAAPGAFGAVVARAPLAAPEVARALPETIDPPPARPAPEPVAKDAFSKRTGSVQRVRAVAPKDTSAKTTGPTQAKVNKPPAESEQRPRFVIELSDEPLWFAGLFSVDEPAEPYEDELDLVTDLIYIEKPEPLFPIEVREPPGGFRRPPVPPPRAKAKPKPRPKPKTRAKVVRPKTKPTKSSATQTSDFSFVSVVDDEPQSATVEPRPQKRPPKDKPNSKRNRSATTSAVPKAKPNKPAPRPLPPRRREAYKLMIREVSDEVELLLMEHKDIQLRHFGPITIESTLWPPGMRLDSINQHLSKKRWPRDEALEVWVRLPQICDELWRELSIVDIASGSTIETWISLTDLHDKIVHQMRLSLVLDKSVSPQGLLRTYRGQAEQFVGYGLDALLSEPEDSDS